jgi:hypothetical protein
LCTSYDALAVSSCNGTKLQHAPMHPVDAPESLQRLPPCQHQHIISKKAVMTPDHLICVQT